MADVGGEVGSDAGNRKPPRLWPVTVKLEEGAVTNHSSDFGLEAPVVLGLQFGATEQGDIYDVAQHVTESSGAPDGEIAHHRLAYLRRQ